MSKAEKLSTKAKKGTTDLDEVVYDEIPLIIEREKDTPEIARLRKLKENEYKIKEKQQAERAKK